MLKYIITWVVVSMQTTSCPDVDKANDFGVKSSQYMGCLVRHFKTVEDPRSETFTSRDSAQAFYNKVKVLESNAFNFNSELIQKVRLDSLNIK